MKCHLTGPSLNTLCPALTTPTSSSSSSSSSSSNQLRWRQVPPEQSLGLTRFELKTSDVRGCSQCSVSPLPGTCDECLLCRFYTWFPVWCDLDKDHSTSPHCPPQLSWLTSEYLVTDVTRCGQPVGCLQEHVAPLSSLTSITIRALRLRAQTSDGCHPGRGVPRSRLVSPSHRSAPTVLPRARVAFGRLKSGIVGWTSSVMIN